MSESVELLGCPFCGNTPKVREPFGLVRSGYQIACYSDECFGPRTTAHELEDCIAQWNCRATPPAAPAGGESKEARSARRRGHTCSSQYVMRELPDPDCAACNAAPAQSIGDEGEREAAVERIMSIRNGMTPDMEARAIVRRELAALAALKDAQS